MRPLRLLIALACAAIAATTGSAAAHAAPQTPPPCVTPDGTDLNQLYGIEQRIVGPSTCREVRAGERWVMVGSPWITAADAADAVYPDGYVPQLPDPIEDFNAKFTGARYVVDAGTPHERVVTAGREVLLTGFVGADGLPFSAFPSPVLKPVRPGEHTFAIYLTLSAQHCDGLGTVIEANCIPAGESQWVPDLPFQAVPKYGVPVRP